MGNQHLTIPLFDTAALPQLLRGRAEKHLRTLVPYHGEVMTQQQRYERLAPSCRYVTDTIHYKKEVNFFGALVEGEECTTPEYRIQNEEGFFTDVPKILFDVCRLPMKEVI